MGSRSDLCSGGRHVGQTFGVLIVCHTAAAGLFYLGSCSLHPVHLEPVGQTRSLHIQRFGLRLSPWLHQPRPPLRRVLEGVSMCVCSNNLLADAKRTCECVSTLELYKMSRWSE